MLDHPNSLSKFTRTAVLFIRTDPDESSFLTAEIQEAMLRRTCEERQIRILDVIRIECGAEASLQYLAALLPKLPKGCDSLLSARFYVYSNALKDLSELCRLYQREHVELCCLEYLRPLRYVLRDCGADRSAAPPLGDGRPK